MFLIRTYNSSAPAGRASFLADQYYRNLTFLRRSVREDLSDLQWPADHQEEDAREEADTEPGVQRVVRVRAAAGQ